ncbi:fibulin-1-like [Engraulis encrasicolus]|uniref:fibulin-1-like n=1 Tax=Engraulis encrasicolus TaxID=184585 RepID=UPI002FD14B88
MLQWSQHLVEGSPETTTAYKNSAIMYQRITGLLLLSVCCTLADPGFRQPNAQECCKDGRERARDGQDCSLLPVISGSASCRIAQEQCCTAAMEDLSCIQGINQATANETCKLYLFTGNYMDRRTAKTCCDCCMLGVEAKREASNCDLDISVNKRCQQVAQDCCSSAEGHSLPRQGIVNIGARHSENLPTRSPCEGSRCSQLCVGNGVCACLEGYSLRPDGFSCDDVSECVVGSASCQQGEQCVNTLGSFRCQRQASCGTGYEPTDSNLCKDIDECLTGTHNCGAEFRCENKPGSFACLPRSLCHEGYIQDAVGNCIDINECLILESPCPLGQTCVNTPGSYSCERHHVSCSRGYHLTDDGNRCLDVDECKGSQPACDGHGCVNLLGTFRCECKPGFIFNSINKICEDINECRHYPGQLCAHRCENTPGSYQCSCNTGFTLASDGRNCNDLNECESNPCSQECANVYGSYQCYCQAGYQLSDIDGATCEDVDECALSTGGKVCSYQCTNTEGSYQCSCPATGYTLAPNGRTCQDIDECATGSHTCNNKETCFNIQGGFRCLSFDCPPNFRRIADNRCELLPCRGQGRECRSLPLRISFYSLTFPTNLPAPADVFRMGPSNAIPEDGVRLAIVGGNEEGYFSTQKQGYGGVITLQRTLTQPRDFLLSVEMRLTRFGTVSFYLAKIAVFVTHGQPVPPIRLPYSNDIGLDRHRCLKSCPPHDTDCVMDTVKIISHTIISLTTYKTLQDPEEIILLRTMVSPKSSSPYLSARDVNFDILKGNVDSSFDVVKRLQHNKVVGVVRLVKPLQGPLDTILEVAINHTIGGILSHTNIVLIHVFISEFRF